MIVIQVTDPQLRRAAQRAAHHEEDAIVDETLALDAIEWGFPRLVIRDAGSPRYPLPPRLGLLEIDDETRGRWDSDRRVEDPAGVRADYLVRRMADAMEIAVSMAPPPSGRVDRILADLNRAAGQRLPAPLRGFGRRVLDFPYYYTSLHAFADTCGTTRGALKAKFRRRGLASPSTYLRWFRMLAVAHLLSDRSVPVAVAAGRLGFTSDGNLCRAMWTATSMTPTDVRTVKGWNRLLINFAWNHLDADALEAWASMDELFEREVA